MQKILKVVNNLSVKRYIFLSLLVANIVTIPINYIYIYIGKSFGGVNIAHSMSIFELYFITTILSPIIESILIVFMNKLISKFLKDKIKITILISILFACFHSYSFLYMILIFIPSFIFVYSYILYRNRRINPFFLMTIIHILYNFTQLVSSELIRLILVKI